MENEILADILVKKGYQKESAQKCVDDVLEARLEYRLNTLKKYQGKRVKAEFDGLMFDVIVHDVKIDHEGKKQFQVQPLNGGTKMAWIKKISLN